MESVTGNPSTISARQFLVDILMVSAHPADSTGCIFSSHLQGVFDPFMS